MHIHYLQHIPYEDLGMMLAWAQEKGMTITKTGMFQYETLPGTHDYDWLIILGGPMNIYQENDYPWLIQEKKYIHESIRQGKRVLGICLGAQLIADCLGAKTVKAPHKEIGWYPVKFVQPQLSFGEGQELMGFHWHQDMFNIPAGAKLIACSRACPHQGFTYNDGQIIGLQFHMELTQKGIQQLLHHGQEDLDSSRFVQTKKVIIQQMHHLQSNHQHMRNLLDHMLNEHHHNKSNTGVK